MSERRSPLSGTQTSEARRNLGEHELRLVNRSNYVDFDISVSTMLRLEGGERGRT